MFPSGLVQRFFILSLPPAPLKGGISEDSESMGAMGREGA